MNRFLNKKGTDQAYTHLSHFYDQLMDVDYDRWLLYLEETWKQFGIKPEKILELGCGTGNITIPLAQKGHQMTAIDFSSSMLEHAQAKAKQFNVKINFQQQDMCDLSLDNQQYDLVLCCCDALNYLTTKSDLTAALRQAYNHTVTGGYLLFDLNSEYKLRELYGNQAYADLFADYGYFWENQFDEETEICQMDLTFFIPTDQNLYQRVSERHFEKLWRPSEVFDLLQATGWEVVGYFGFDTFEEPGADDERWQFVAKKMG